MLGGWRRSRRASDVLHAQTIELSRVTDGYSEFTFLQAGIVRSRTEGHGVCLFFVGVIQVSECLWPGGFRPEGSV
jgi:hypothetical protein